MNYIMVALKLAGFVMNFWKSKEERMKWMVESSDILHEKGWLTSRQLLELEQMRSDEIDAILDAQEVEAAQDSNEERAHGIESIEKPVVDRIFEPPVFVKVKGVRIRSDRKWKFQTENGMPYAAGVHFTAGAEDEHSHKDAIGTLKYLVSKNLCCPVVDHDGVAYIPENFDPYSEWGYNFGKSEWRGRTGVSRLIMGLEFVNSGKLIKFNGKYYAWYDLVIKNNKPISVKKDKRFHPNPRTSGPNENIQPGTYDPLTPEQETFIFRMNAEIKRRNPFYNVEWAAGHDEVAMPRGRKNDPGASLSTTMSKCRENLERELKSIRRNHV